MKRFALLVVSFMILTACVHESAVPLGNNMAQIDVSAAAVYGRAGAQRIAMQNAAKTTIQMGYDKLIVVKTNGWNESTISGGSTSSFSGSGGGGSGSVSGSEESGFTSIRHPESNLVIYMFHKGDKGSRDAVDAQKYLDLVKDDSAF